MIQDSLLSRPGVGPGPIWWVNGASRELTVNRRDFTSHVKTWPTMNYEQVLSAKYGKLRSRSRPKGVADWVIK